MIDIGVASPSAHGQAMISTETAATSACGSRGGVPTVGPDHERDSRDRDDRRHEPGGHGVGQALDRRAGALGLTHQLDDPGQHRVAADPLGAP